MEKNRFSLNKDLITQFNDIYPEKKIELLETNTDSLLKKYDELKESLNDDDYKCLFISSNITKEIKLEILSKLEISSIKESRELYIALQKYLDDISVLSEIEDPLFLNLNAASILPINGNVISRLRKIDDKEESKELNKLIEENYISILKKLNILEFTEVEYLFLFEKLETFEEQKLFLNSFDISKLSKDSGLMSKLIEFIVASDNDRIVVSCEKLIILIKNISDETNKVRILISQLEFLDNVNIKNILRELDTPYSTLTSLRQVSFEISELNELFLKELEKKGVVSSYNEKNDEFVAYIKKSFIQLPTD